MPIPFRLDYVIERLSKDAGPKTRPEPARSELRRRAIGERGADKPPPGREEARATTTAASPEYFA